MYVLAAVMVASILISLKYSGRVEAQPPSASLPFHLVRLNVGTAISELLLLFHKGTFSDFVLLLLLNLLMNQYCYDYVYEGWCVLVLVNPRAAHGRTQTND